MTNEELEMKAAEYLEVGGMGHMVAGHFLRNPGEDGFEASAIWNEVANVLTNAGLRPFEEAIERLRFGSN